MLARKKLLGEYKIGRTIGEGAFSKVKLATHKVTGQKVGTMTVPVATLTITYNLTGGHQGYEKGGVGE